MTLAFDDEAADALVRHSPVYWGERRPLLRAIVARKNAGLKETDPWYGQADGRKPALPGVYAPFPAWGTLVDADSGPTGIE